MYVLYVCMHIGRDVIFLSEKAIFNGAKAIRGGIPLVFPQVYTVLINSKSDLPHGRSPQLFDQHAS